MSMGLGIALVVIGAILYFAVDVPLEAVNFDLIGIILMIAGAVIFVIGLVLMVRKRQVTTTSHTSVDPVAGERVTQRSTTSNEPPVA